MRLTDDAWFTMPPLPLEYQGRRLAGQFLAAAALRPWWTVCRRTVGLLVITLSGDRISAMIRFDAALLAAWQ
jgi:RNA polymerase sigma-70 factor (ECF subfamily)